MVLFVPQYYADVRCVEECMKSVNNVLEEKRGGALAPRHPVPPGPQQPAHRRPVRRIPERHREIQLDQEGTYRDKPKNLAF